MSIQRDVRNDEWAVLNALGYPFCEYDSIDNVEEDTTASVPTEPQEGGRIYSYDKVPHPAQVTVSLLFGGDYAKQQAAYSKLEAYRAGVETFTVVTPAKVSSNMAVVSVSRSQSSSNGMNLLTVDVGFIEIKNSNIKTNTVTWSPRNPTSANQVDKGKNQSVLKKVIS